MTAQILFMIPNLLDNINTLLLAGDLSKFPHQNVRAVVHQRNHLFHLHSTECWSQRVSNASPLFSLCSVQHAGKGLWRFDNLLQKKSMYVRQKHI